MNAPNRILTNATAPPRVSVISIFFNAEQFFEEAITSVLAQDFDEFELLLVDDGSMDSSSAIARRYAARDPRVRYLRHPDGSNHGMSATRNLGLNEARGEFIAFIDADDRWLPQKLKAQVALLDRMVSVDAVAGTVNYWSSHDGGKDRLVPTAHARNRSIPPGEATIKVYPLGKAHAPSMSDLMFRRTAIEATGGFEERFTGAYEDQAFLSKLYLNATLFVADAVWSDYRLHDSSCMAKIQQQGRYADARHAFLKWFERHLARSRFAEDQAKRRALKRALGACERRNFRTALAESPIGKAIRTGKAGFRRLRPLLMPGPAILMYHRVAEERFDPWELAVSPANFEDQLDWLARNRTVLPLAELVDLLRKRRLPNDAIALTFDDGYACNINTAVPLLEQFRIPATIFIPAELIRHGREFWWDELERIVMRAKAKALELDGNEIYLGAIEAGDEQWPPGNQPETARQQAYRQLWSQLYPRSPQEIEAGMRQLRMQAGVADNPRDTHRPMTPHEVRNLQSDVIEFGSHALSHPSLPALGPTEKKREIAYSVEACSALAGRPVRLFAYPYGDSDPETELLAEEAGFICACKADGGFVTRRSSCFALPRMPVGDWDSTRLARQLGRP